MCGQEVRYARSVTPGPVHETRSAAATEEFGAAVARDLVAGDVVLVSGEMGAGKTTLVRGACRALGVRGPVTSPTFNLARRYAGRLQVSHVDLYRLDGGLTGEDPALLAEYIESGDVVFVEWADRGGAWPGRVARRVRLTHLGRDRRRIEVEPAGIAARLTREGPAA